MFKFRAEHKPVRRGNFFFEDTNQNEHVSALYLALKWIHWMNQSISILHNTTNHIKTHKIEFVVDSLLFKHGQHED